MQYCNQAVFAGKQDEQLFQHLVDALAQVAAPRSADDLMVGVENHDGVAAVLILVAVPTTDIPADEPLPFLVSAGHP